jgi:hypothetical protein
MVGGGSTGNITADLIRDLKAKETEVDAMRNREVWMKAALSKASRSGFVYEDQEAGEGDLGLSSDEQKISELVLKFKQFRAQIQVRFLHFMPTMLHIPDLTRLPSLTKLEIRRNILLMLSESSRVLFKRRRIIVPS